MARMTPVMNSNIKLLYMFKVIAVEMNCYMFNFFTSIFVIDSLRLTRRAG